MVDVQVLTRTIFVTGFWFGLATLALVLLLARQQNTRRYLQQGLFSGAILTLSMIATIIIIALVSWDFFFTGFHQLFFESGTWRFYFSDTLIRLFPEQFWVDASIVIGTLTTLGALAILLITWRWGKLSKLEQCT